MDWEDIIPQRGARINASPGVTVALRVPENGRPLMAVTIGRELRDALGWQPKQRIRVQRNQAAGLIRLSLTDDPSAGYSLHGAASNSCAAVSFHLPGLPVERHKSEPAENVVKDGALIFTAPAWARVNVTRAMPDGAPVLHSRASSKLDEPLSQPAVKIDMPTAAARPTISDKIKAGIAASKAAREAGVPLPASPGSGKASKLHAPTDADAADPDARDKLEAKQELRKGKSVRDVARDFGFRIDLVSRWQEEILAERAGRAA